MKRITCLLVFMLLLAGASRAEDFVARQQAQVCVDNLKRIKQALELYKIDYGVYPTTLDALVPKYLAGVPLCPIATADTYSAGYIGKGKTYVVFCGGLHHKAAGLDENLPAMVNGQVVPPVPARTAGEQDWDALSGAIFRRDLRMVDEVAPRSDIRENQAEGVPALNYALAIAVAAHVRCHRDVDRRRSMDVVRAIITAGGQVNSVVARETVLNTALLSEDPELIRMLLEHGANPNLQNSRGQSALMSLIVGYRVHDRSRLLTLVDLLMAHHANPDQKSPSGLTPRLAARQYGLIDVEALLGRKL
ncbi:MAG: hypothetical protein ACYCW6_24080 [Candidatus Xenobia bacterium]